MLVGDTCGPGVWLMAASSSLGQMRTCLLCGVEEGGSNNGEERAVLTESGAETSTKLST